MSGLSVILRQAIQEARMADYADIAVLSDNWTGPVTITETQIWQCSKGEVRISTKADPTGDTGLRLGTNDWAQIGPGKTVFYRGVNTAVAVAVISREVMS